MFDDLTAVIVTYRSGYIIQNCLKPLKKLKIKTIVVDNQSPDNTVKVVEKAYPQAQIIRSKGNLGFGRGNNLGIKAAKTKYVLVMNPDVVVNKNGLKKLLEVFKSDKSIVITSPVTTTSEIYKKNKSYDTFDFQRNDPFKIIDNKMYIRWVSGCCLMMDKKKMQKNIGFFDENIFLFQEDDDLSYRVDKSKFNMVLVNDALLIHEEEQGSERTNKVSRIKTWHLSWSSLYYCQKIKSLKKARIKAIRAILSDFSKIVRCKQIKKSLIRINAYFSFLFGLKAFKDDNLSPR